MPHRGGTCIRKRNANAMIARCIHTDYSICDGNRSLQEMLGNDANQKTSTSLEFGGEYLVVALALGPSSIWLFLADRFRGLRYPLVYPVNLFAITDSRRSRLWEWGRWTDRFGNGHDLLAPQEWARVPMFHGMLFDGDETALLTYESVLQELEMEYPLPWVSERAVRLSTGNWVTDVGFEDQWEANPAYAMTRHPRTKRWMHNPLFEESIA